MGGDEGERETGKRIGVSGVTLASSLWKLEFAANQSPDSSPPWQMLPLFDIIFALRTYLSFISITSKNLLPLLLGYSPQGIVQFLSASCLRASENSPPSLRASSSNHHLHLLFNHQNTYLYPPLFSPSTTIMAPGAGKSVFLGNIPYSMFPVFVLRPAQPPQWHQTNPSLPRPHGRTSQRHPQLRRHSNQIPPDDEPRDR